MSKIQYSLSGVHYVSVCMLSSLNTQHQLLISVTIPQVHYSGVYTGFDPALPVCHLIQICSRFVHILVHILVLILEIKLIFYVTVLFFIVTHVLSVNKS